MTQQPLGRSRSSRTTPLSLEFPQSLGTYDDYADHDFTVQDCLIVGTDLRQVERVTGRLTWGKVILGGIGSGLWMGLLIGLIFALFTTAGALSVIISSMAFGAVFFAVMSAAGYAATRGRRDFTSVSQVVATRYELLCEHKHAQRARELLSQLGGVDPSLGFDPHRHQRGE